MANKLAKHGYPRRGKWHHAYSLSEIMERLRKDEVSLTEIIEAWSAANL
jgi:hypothetical protein